MLRRALVVLATASALALASPSGAATQTVRAVGVSFVAPVIVAAAGDSITLNTLDLLPHTFTTTAAVCAGTSGKVACNTGVVSGINATGTVTLATMNVAGTYDFFCDVHRSLGMVGKLVIR